MAEGSAWVASAAAGELLAADLEVFEAALGGLTDSALPSSGLVSGAASGLAGRGPIIPTTRTTDTTGAIPTTVRRELMLWTATGIVLAKAAGSCCRTDFRSPA